MIAADGIHSTAVEAILGHSNNPQPAKHSNCCYRFLIPRAKLEADPETRFFVQSPAMLSCRLYADPATKRRLVVYPCRKYVKLWSDMVWGRTDVVLAMRF